MSSGAPLQNGPAISADKTPNQQTQRTIYHTQTQNRPFVA